MIFGIRMLILSLALFQIGNASLLGSLLGGIGKGGKDGGQCCDDKEPLTLTLALPLGKQSSCGCESTKQIAPKPHIIPQPQIIPQQPLIIPQPQIIQQQPQIITIPQPQYIQQQPLISACQQQVVPQPIVYEQPQIIQQPSCGCGCGGF